MQSEQHYERRPNENQCACHNRTLPGIEVPETRPSHDRGDNREETDGYVKDR